MEIVAPGPGATVSMSTDFVAALDGDEGGPVQWTLDGDVLGTPFTNPTTGEATLTLLTEALPNGTYTLQAEALFWGLTDTVTVTMQNDELLVYELGSTVFTLLQPFPNSVDVTVVEPGVSLQIQVENDLGSPVDLLYGFLQDPLGDYQLGTESDATYRSGASGAEPFAGGVPGHPYAAWPAGEYTVLPYAGQGDEGVTLYTRALVKRTFDAVAAGRLSLDFYFVGGSGLTAGSAPTDSDFGDFVDALEGVFLGAEVMLGDLRYFDLPAPANLVDTYPELVDLFRQSVTSQDRTLPVFFLSDLDMPQANPVGIAAHVPGPALASGSGQAGVAMVTDWILDGDAGTAAALAGHEIGHFLGLYHSSEIGGGTHDSLTDTAAACDASDCWATNLMDPYLYGNTSLSADQSWVILRHPLVELVDPSTLPSAVRSRLPDAPPGEGLSGFCQIGAGAL